MVHDSIPETELTEDELDELLEDLADVLFSKWLDEVNRSGNMKSHNAEREN